MSDDILSDETVAEIERRLAKYADYEWEDTLGDLIATLRYWQKKAARTEKLQSLSDSIDKIIANMDSGEHGELVDFCDGCEEHEVAERLKADLDEALDALQTNVYVDDQTYPADVEAFLKKHGRLK